MIIFPAIDLKEGQAVRLQQGDMARATVFNADPAAQAKAFEDQGFEYLHIVDLDGAFAGKPVNGDAVDRILNTVDMPVQLGGGIRNIFANKKLTSLADMRGLKVRVQGAPIWSRTFAAVGMSQTHPDSDIPLLGIPLQFDGVRQPLRNPAPGLGQHTDEILGHREGKAAE